MTIQALAFFVLAFLAVLSGLIVVSHKSAVISALALAFNLVSIAGFFFLLEAYFIAFLQVIVYAGAIMVLILFVLMLLNVEEERRIRTSGPVQKTLGPLAAGVFAAVVGWNVWGASEGATFPSKTEEFGTVRALGLELFDRFWYPFEAISLLLVVAMVGAVLLAKRRL
jgi:NADH-quinone oxidoreductase subunit J